MTFTYGEVRVVMLFFATVGFSFSFCCDRSSTFFPQKVFVYAVPFVRPPSYSISHVIVNLSNSIFWLFYIYLKITRFFSNVLSNVCSPCLQCLCVY